LTPRSVLDPHYRHTLEGQPMGYFRPPGWIFPLPRDDGHWGHNYPREIGPGHSVNQAREIGVRLQCRDQLRLLGYYGPLKGLAS